MEPDRPGWYHDSSRPGLRRYWDGHTWIDVDQVADGHHEPSPVTAAPFLVAQRGPSDDRVRPVEIVEQQGKDDDPSADPESEPEPEPLSD